MTKPPMYVYIFTCTNDPNSGSEVSVTIEAPTFKMALHEFTQVLYDPSIY